jgi:glyoxylase-like metal-dependent hydrolase (beta-lactamase superfamily II)
MFGVVPKTLWQKKNPPDEKNLCTWAMRLLLVEEGDRLILIDTGIGNKQSDKFFSFYEPHGDDSIEGSLKKHGFTPDDITDVFLTHLHFDHVGGAIERQGGKLVPAFKNATYWSHERHWEWATHPNPREKASFLEENILPIEQSGQLQLLQGEQNLELIPGFKLRLVNGHTESQMLPQISYKGRTVVFCADLLPSIHHISIPRAMAFDVLPLATMDEMKSFLPEVIDHDHILFPDHDNDNERRIVQMTDKGPRVKDVFTLADL